MFAANLLVQLLLSSQLNRHLKEPNIPDKFSPCLEAVDTKQPEPQPEVQGGARVGGMEDAVPQTEEQMEQGTARDNLKKIADLQEKLQQLQINLSEEKQLRLGHEEKLMKLEGELKVEKYFRTAESRKMEKLEEELKKEKDLRNAGTEKMKKLEDNLNVEKKGRMSAEARLLKSEESCAECRKLEQATTEPPTRVEQQNNPEQTTQQHKPQLTAAEQEKYGEQMLDACCRGDDKTDINKVRELISMGVDLYKVRDNSLHDNWTPLHYAAGCGFADICQVLLDAAPALIDALDGYHSTALHHAAWEGHLAVVKLLVQRGADPRLKNYGDKKALDDAERRLKKQVADYLRWWTYLGTYPRDLAV